MQLTAGQLKRPIRTPACRSSLTAQLLRPVGMIHSPVQPRSCRKLQKTARKISKSCGSWTTRWRLQRESNEASARSLFCVTIPPDDWFFSGPGPPKHPHVGADARCITNPQPTAVIVIIIHLDRVRPAHTTRWRLVIARGVGGPGIPIFQIGRWSQGMGPSEPYN